MGTSHNDISSNPSRVRSNLSAAMVASFWTSSLGLAVVPVYLRFLGIEAYGLIGFFSTMQALLLILDLGLSQTINREFAILTAKNDLAKAARLLHTFAVVYGVLALIIAVSVAAAAPYIASNWIDAKAISQNVLTKTISLMGLVLAFRWPIAVYLGALFGMQRTQLASKVSIIMVTGQHAGAVAVVIFVSPTIAAFFVWQCVAALLHLLVLRFVTWSALGRVDSARFDLGSLQNLVGFSASVGAVTITAIVLSQQDKILLSSLLTLEDFAVYMLATAVVSCIYVVVTPIFNVIYPLFSTLISSGDVEGLRLAYRRGTRSLAMVLFPTALFLAITATELVQIWTANTGLAPKVGPLISLMIFGSALHGIMYFPYALQLASGKPRIALATNAILILIVCPLTYLLASKLGAVGGAIAWLSFHVVYLLLGAWLTKRYLLRDARNDWLLRDVCFPLGITLLVGFVIYSIRHLAPPISTSGAENIAAGLIAAGLAFVLIFYSAPRSEQWLLQSFLAARRGSI